MSKKNYNFEDKLFKKLFGTKITTPQNVSIILNSSVLGWRILAYLLDTVVIIVYLIIVINLIDDIDGYWYYESIIPKILWFIAIVPAFFYSFFLEFFTNGFTFGKKVFGVRVVKINGLKGGFDDYFMRWIFKIIDIYPVIIFASFFGEAGITGFLIMGIPAIISISMSKNNQRMGDMVAGTTVIKLKQKESLTDTIFKEVSTNYEPVFQQVIKLSDNDMRIIQEIYKSAKKNRDIDVIQKLRNKVETVMQIESEMSDIQFLDTVIYDFNHYTQNM